MPQLSSPRRLAFRGTIEALAWGFPRSLIPREELPARVLALWQSGARLEEFEWGHVLFLPAPQKVRAELAPALVLARHKNALVCAPLARGDELREGTWVIEDGQWQALQNGWAVDVSGWLDVGAWTVPTVEPLGEVPVIPTAIEPVALDLRAQSGIQEPDPKWQAIWERGKGSSSGVNFPVPGFAPSAFFGLFSGLFTPRREVEDASVPLASDHSIVLSGVLVLVSALLFLLRAWSKPAGSNGLPLAILTVILFVVVAGFLMRRSRQSHSPQATSQQAAPLVVSPGVQTLSFVFVGVGLLRMFLSNPVRALVVLVIALVMIGVLRLLGLSGTLIGQRTVAANYGEGAGFGGSGWLSRLLGRWGQGAGGGIGASSPKTRDNMGDLWRRLMANAALRSGLFKTLGRAQARYLLRMMEMFDRGDLDAALRHAIPLGGKSAGGWQPPPALGVPQMRPDLNISLANLPAGGTMNFGPEIQERLTQLYRRAFEKLRDAGEIDKAAFVLADLLHNVEEAVEFLEKHDRFELAAKLAEGRDLPPGLVVRAWWLAGNHKRAVQIAQLKEAFADAIVRLEKSQTHREASQTLRLLWGHHLASQGRYAPAVEAVWPLPQGRPLASKWLRLGLEESVSPRLLARALVLEPDSWNEWRPLLENLLHDERDTNGARRRARFARELDVQMGDANPVLAVAARLTARALLRDGASEGTNIEQSVWNNLLSLSGDGLLKADSRWPAPLHKVNVLALRSEPLEIVVASEGGTLNARDAVLLESGELLVALGEMGARLLSWDGRVKAQFDVPAHTIVGAFDAPRALLLAPRDNIWRVSKLDLSQRKATFWGDLRATCFARSFDGATWFAATDGRVRAFDVGSPTPSALWDSGDMNGVPIELAIGRGSLAALVEKRIADNALLPTQGTTVQSDIFESWMFELPSLILRRRSTPKFPDFDLLLQRRLNLWRRITSTGEQFAQGLEYQANGFTTLSPVFLVDEKRQYTSDHRAQNLFDAVVGESSGYTAILWSDNQSAVASLFHRGTNKVLARIRFEGATQVGAHECENIWVLWDDRGRVLTFNTATSSIEREWILA